VKRLGRFTVRLLLLALGLLFTWQLTAELIEPHLLLWLRPRSPYVEAPSTGGTTVRLYADTRPTIGKIAGLQKGLVWVRDGRALVEEGYGFGCPIVVSNDHSYNARRAEVETADGDGFVRLVKRYDIDTADTPIRLLRRKYRPVPSRGAIVVRYDVYPDGAIDVEVDVTALDAGWQRVYLMNEQGGRRFVRYRDAEGTQLEGEQIGIWASSGAFTASACFEDAGALLGFCVEPEPPAIVYFGRERYNQVNWRGIYYLSWSGVDLELAAPQTVYRYRIVLEAP
jgi:hypothetical protein